MKPGKLSEFIGKNSKKLLIGTAVFLVLCAVGAACYYFFSIKENEGVLVKVGDEEITQDDLDTALYGISFSDDLSGFTSEEREDRLNQLIEYAIAAQEASSLGVSVTEEEVDGYIDNAIGDNYDNYTADQQSQTRQAAKNVLLLNKVKQAAVGWREANYLVINFHKYFTTDNESYQVEGMGDAALIAQNKADALILANSLSSRLKSGEITFDQAKMELLADSKFGLVALEPRTPEIWGIIEKNYFVDGLLDEETANTLYALSKGEISDPVADKGEFGGSDGEELEYRYFIYQVTGASDSEYSSYGDWLAAMKDKYNVNSESLLSYIATKAYAAVSNATCRNRCDVDNAELYVKLSYYDANSNKVALSNFDGITASGSKEVANYPWALNDGSNCSSPTLLKDLNGTTDGSGAWSSCTNGGYSYFCSTASILYVAVGEVTLNNTVSSQGRWTWDHKTAANNYSGTLGGRDIYEVPYTVGTMTAILNLRENRNKDVWGMNGKQLREEFSWHPMWNNAPIPSHVSPVNGKTYILANGASTTTVNFTGKATDVNNDKVKLRAAYYKKNADNTWSLVTYLPASDYTNLYAQNSTVPLGSASLGVGEYKWRVWAMDEHGTPNPNDSDGWQSGYAGEWIFSVSRAAVSSLSCTVSPRTGLAPLVVSASAAGGLAPYDYNMGNGDTYFDRSSLIYFTYPKAGEYTVTVTDSNGTPASCLNSPITVTDSNDSSGGEVSP